MKTEDLEKLLECLAAMKDKMQDMSGTIQELKERIVSLEQKVWFLEGSNYIN